MSPSRGKIKGDMMKRNTFWMLVVVGILAAALMIWAMISLKVGGFTVGALVVGVAFWILLLKAKGEKKKDEENWKQKAEIWRQEANSASDTNKPRPRGSATGIPVLR